MSPTSLSPLEVANARLLALRANFAADKKLSAPSSPAAGQHGLENDTAEQENRVAEQEIRVTPQENGTAMQENGSAAPESDSAEQEHDLTAHGNAIADLCNTLPSHLGWGSEAVTAHLRRQRGVSAEPVAAVKAVTITATENSEATPNRPAIEAEAIAPIPSPAPATIKLYPDIALALLRTERVADGRLWLLLRALDENGRGHWTRRAAYAKLTRDDAPYRICGERQLRKLLERGEGLFWHQDEQKRIWLHSQAKVAAALDIGRIQHKPVALPLLILCQPIGDVRAHLYASFHSSRDGCAGTAQQRHVDTPQQGRSGSNADQHEHRCRNDNGRRRNRGKGAKQSMPISRQTLTTLSGVCPRTQQAYEERANVQAERCLAVGAVETPVLSCAEAATSTPLSASVSSQEAMWKNGRAGFLLRDHLGKQGEKGKIYHARRLPNRYSGPHAAASGHGRRRLNRQLIDLRQKGAGNGQVTASQAESERQTWVQRYAANGAVGAEMWSKAGGKRPIYWRGRGGKDGIIIWQTLPELDG